MKYLDSVLPAWLRSPVFEGEEEKTRIAGLLNVILWIIFGLVTLFTVPAIILTLSLERVLVELVLLLIAAGLFYLLQRGQVNLSAFLLCLMLWAVISIGTFASSGFHGSTMSSYFGIIMIAGLLLGGRAGIFFGGLSILATGLMYYAEVKGWLPPMPPQAITATLWLEFSVTALGIVGLLSLAVNSLNNALTRAREGERQLAAKVIESQQLARQAGEASAYKSQLIARVSHELRTPLGAMLGMTEMLHYGTYGILSPEQKQITQRIIDNASYLERVFDELLQQSQIDAGRLALDAQPLALQSLLERVETAFRISAERKQLVLKTELGPNLPEKIWGDPKRLEQILLNLVGNAVKFTHEGSVQVRFYRHAEAQWGIKVSDTGIGISAEAQEYIFEPFRQADETPARQYGGTGLGLSIVRQLVELMEGEIHLESRIGRGSTFQVILPLQAAENNQENNP